MFGLARDVEYICIPYFILKIYKTQWIQQQI